MQAYHEIQFYVTRLGNPVVLKQLNELDIKSRAKVLRTLELVRRYGLSNIIPQLKKLASSPLWELRILGKDNIRIILCKDKRRRIIVLNVFFKKTRKTPQNILKVALKRFIEIDN